MAEIKDFEVAGLPENIPVDIRCDERGAAFIYTVTIGKKGGEVTNLSNFTVILSADSSEAVGRWYPSAVNRGVKETWNSLTKSRYTSGAPIYSYYCQNDENRLTVAVDDSFTMWEIRSGIDEKSRRIGFEISPNQLKTDCKIMKLFVDRSKRPYYEALKDAVNWWAELKGAETIPESAFDPVYSTWYAIKRNVNYENVFRQCQMAAELGCKTVFIDDGWAAPYETKAFSNTGDWKADSEKFPNFKEFVERIHSLGMKVVLWISPCFVGVSSRSANLYKGKFLYKSDTLCCSVLDPRYPDVRANICRDICNLVSEYGVDGLKIDFIDSVHGDDCEPGDERDYISVAEAMKDLLTNVHSNLQKLNPDVLIEYRQSYTGPDILATANIVRNGDCAQDFLTNRLNTIDLRLHTNAAVHSDMVQIIENEAADCSALQITNILFSTPQISVRPDLISEEQRKMLKFWLNFMSDKRELLQRSSFEPSRCYANYPSVTARNSKERLTALYAENLLILDELADCVYVVNACGREPIYLGCKQPGVVEYTLIDCMGNEIAGGSLSLGVTPTAINIPYNGMMILRS